MTRKDLIEREANNYHSRMFLSRKAPSINNFNSDIGSQLYAITREQDRIIFLNKLKNLVKDELEKHRLVCKNPEKCQEEEEKGFALFAIDQLMETVVKDYDYKPDNPNDEFKADDITNLDNKMDIIIAMIKELGVQHDEIYDEINDLRYHFNLGKKNWWSLLKGKMVEWAGSGVSAIVLQKIAEETGLTESFEQALKALTK